MTLKAILSIRRTGAIIRRYFGVPKAPIGSMQIIVTCLLISNYPISDDVIVKLRQGAELPVELRSPIRHLILPVKASLVRVRNSLCLPVRGPLSPFSTDELGALLFSLDIAATVEPLPSETEQIRRELIGELKERGTV
jgi:hypothetical protein